MQEKQDVMDKQSANQQPVNNSTNTQLVVQEEEKKAEPQTQVMPKRRVRRIGDVINFDGELYKVYKIKDEGKKIGLRRMNIEEVKAFLIKQRHMQEAAIRKVKEIDVNQAPKRVIDMPQERPTEPEKK